MPKEVTIILDSGFFLPKAGSFCEIGYFQCEATKSDITVTVDGNLARQADLLKLGGGSCTVQIHHKNADDTTKRDGITIPVPFHDNLLHMQDLYQRDIEVARDKFDCILLFESGELRPENIKERRFNRFKELPSRALSLTPEETKKSKAIAHDISVRFTLADGESIQLTRDGKPFWSSAKLGVQASLEIKIGADGLTTEKFYRHCLMDARDSYWMPNSEDPPPCCPVPPCPDGGGG